MSAKVQKWGNSLASRLPKAVTERFKLRQGSPVRIVPRPRHIVVKPSPAKRQTLAELVRRITPDNRHELIRRGKPVGREVW